MTENNEGVIRRFWIETSTDKYPFEKGETLIDYAQRVARKFSNNPNVFVRSASVTFGSMDVSTIGRPNRYIPESDLVEIEFCDYPQV
jgi:hypothetical protein